MSSVQRRLYALFQNQCPHFLMPPLSRRISQPSSQINKMVNRHTVNYHLSPSSSNSRIHPLIFLWTPLGLTLSTVFVEFFLKLVHTTMVVENFQIYVVKIDEQCICDSKNFFLLMISSKTLPQVLIITSQAEKNYSLPLGSLF